MMDDLFHKLDTFSFILDNERVIQSVSVNLDKDDSFEFVGRTITDVLSKLFDNERFSNKRHLESVFNKVKSCIEDSTSLFDKVTVTNDLNTKGDSYRYRLSIDVFNKEDSMIVVKFIEFEKQQSTEDLYLSLFDDYDEYFFGLYDLLQYGKFIVNYSISKNLVYGSKMLPRLMDIEQSSDNTYIVTRFNKTQTKYSIVLDDLFFEKLDSLYFGENNYLTHDFKKGDKQLRIEAQILKRDKNNKPFILGGVAYDITRYRDYDELFHMKAIYDLAINVGKVGIFYYDFEKFGKDKFEANDIYGNILGIKPNKSGLFSFKDFEKAVMKVEDEFLDGTDTLKTVKNFFEGKIEGVNDDIIKIRNHITGKELYLLSSSRIEDKFEDGTPKRFGGIVIDITDRIENEKNKHIFAYTDELTRLPNKRKLQLDLQEKTKGIGLFFDLDNFKKINDEFGHSAGDEALKIYAEAMNEASSDYIGVTPYRLYGDEFFVFIENDRTNLVEEFRDKVIELSNIKLKHLDMPLSSSMGTSYYDQSVSIDDFIKDADYRMYEEKISKKKSR